MADRHLAVRVHGTGVLNGRPDRDAVNPGPGMVGRDGMLTFRPQKTGDFPHVPWTRGLPAHVAHQVLIET